jgi:hypothetical protein
MIEKNTQHKFKTNDVGVEVTEYPFQPGEEFHLSIKPKNMFDGADIYGAREGEQTLCLSRGEFLMWVKADEGFVDMLEKAVKAWRKGWKDNDERVAQALEQIAERAL